MTFFFRKGIFQPFRQICIYSPARRQFKMPGGIDHATGLERMELLALSEGNEDPWDFKVRKRGPGTLENPNLIPSAFQARIVGCICHPDDNHCNWMWLHMGIPKRCECGYWFQLVERDPL